MNKYRVEYELRGRPAITYVAADSKGEAARAVQDALGPSDWWLKRIITLKAWPKVFKGGVIRA